MKDNKSIDSCNLRKVVYIANYCANCFGGVALSSEAIALYEKYNGLQEYPYIERHDPILVRVVEELGEESSRSEDLQIQEVTGKYFIIESNEGQEIVMELDDIEIY